VNLRRAGASRGYVTIDHLSEVDQGVVVPVSVFLDDISATRNLHHARYALLLDRALLRHWTDRGFRIPYDRDTVQVVRELTVRYDEPVAEFGEIGVRLWIEHVGRTSARYAFRMFSAGGDVLHAHGSRVNINIDPATMRPAPWSDRMLEELNGISWLVGTTPRARHVSSPLTGITMPATVYADDLDALGHLHHARFGLLVDRVLRQHRIEQGRREGESVGELSMTYERPVDLAGDVLVHFWTAQVDEITVRHEFQILSPSGGIEYARGHRVDVRAG
jgi:acyl-CoA thioester hydrolase